jgi:hypothetical protein
MSSAVPARRRSARIHRSSWVSLAFVPLADTAPAPRRTRSRALRAVTALIATLLLAEGGARLLEPALAEPRLYADDTTAVKVLQMDRLGCADVVLAGNSMGRDAFDPATFTAADPADRLAYNASLDAASPALLGRWLVDEVVPRLHPAQVVVSLASLDLNANSAAGRAARRAYDDADMTGSGPARAALRRLNTASALVRNRRELRDPAAVAAAVSRRWSGPPAPRLSADGLAGVVGPDGEGRSRRELIYRHDTTTRAFTRQQLLGDWTLDPEQVSALDELVTALQAEGTDVTLVLLPVTGDYRDLHPRGAADLDEFRTAVHAVGRSTGAPLVDLLDERPAGLTDDGAFADTHHLNGVGQQWFSTTLPARLSPPAINRSRCEP